MKEKEWRNILETKDYMVSSDGDIYSLLTNKILRPQLNPKGYHMASFVINKQIKGKSIHRLVAIAFLPNTENKLQVNHINGIKTDNRVENLEWATQSENQLHAFRTGLNNAKGERNSFSKLTNDKVLEIRKFYSQNPKEKLKVYAEKYNCTLQLVSMIIRRRAWAHI